MEKLKFYITFLLLISLQSCSTENNNEKPINDQTLYLGSDQLINENLDLIKNKHLGIISNKASVLSGGYSLIDTLKKIKGIKIQAIFAPEHGFSIDVSAGELISDSINGDIPVYSLYGKTRKPAPEMLKNIDLLVFDLQDVGTRFYTYISTLFYVMQAAAENHIPLIVLDRPNPIGGLKIEGPVLNDGMESFIGIAPIPIVHGMTIAEIATMFSGEGWLGKEVPALNIIKMKNWKRDRFFDDFNLKWINPSPNISGLEAALLYPATGLLEGTNISDGRGTDYPFQQIGSPFINSEELIKLLDSLKHEGLSISRITFIPKNIPGKADNSKYLDKNCNGILLKITNKEIFKPVEFGIKLLFAFHKLYPEKFKFDPEYFDKLTGEKQIRNNVVKESATC